MASTTPTVSRSRAGLWTERQIRLAHRVHINDTWRTRTAISTPVIAGLATSLVHLLTTQMTSASDWPTALIGLAALSLILLALWATWTVDVDPTVRTLRAKLRAEMATAAVLDDIAGAVALHDRRLGRFGAHLDHIVVTNNAIAVIGNIPAGGDGVEQDFARRKFLADLLEAGTFLEGNLKIEAIAFVIEDDPSGRNANSETGSHVSSLPRESLPLRFRELVGDRSADAVSLDLIHHVSALCPPMLTSLPPDER